MPNPIALFETYQEGVFVKKKKSRDSCAKCGDEIFHLFKFFSATAIIIPTPGHIRRMNVFGAGGCSTRTVH